MNQFSFLFSPTALALGHTLLYSLLQAFIVFICLRLILKMIPHASAKIKYSVSFIAYITIALWFVITLVVQLNAAQKIVAYQQMIDNTVFQATSLDAINSSSVFSFSYLNSYLPFIVGFYLMGMVWFAIRLVYNYFQTNQLKTKGLTLLNEEWQQKIMQLAEKLNIEKKVSAYFSKYIDTPMMIGFLKPVILLPVAMINHLSAQQFEAILLHELAHIRRNDYLLNLLQSIIDTVLFFNPFTWWITKNIREEREKCCDEMVLQLSDPYHYARALLALEEPLRNRALVMTAVGKRSQLLHRIKNIMEMKNNRINLRQKLVALLVIATATFSVAWLSPKEAATHEPQKHLSNLLALSEAGTAPFINTILPMRTFCDTNPSAIAPLLPPSALAPDKLNAHAGESTAPPPVPPIPPLPPVANAPTPPLPPMPPFPKLNDSFPPLTNYFNSEEWKKVQEEVAKSTADMQKYFQSDAWKKQQQEIQKNAAKMQEYFKSDAWKKQQAEIQKSSAYIQEYLNSPEWKKYQEEIQKSTKYIQEYFNSPEWKKHQEEIRHATDSLSAYFKSDAWKKQQENIQKSFAQTQKYFESADWKKQQAELKAKIQKQQADFQKLQEEQKKNMQDQKEMQKKQLEKK
jgi:beta-lactamase regulating signal transducer with metallopeptidase domain